MNHTRNKQRLLCMDMQQEAHLCGVALSVGGVAFNFLKIFSQGGKSEFYFLLAPTELFSLAGGDGWNLFISIPLSVLCPSIHPSFSYLSNI